MNGSVCVYFGDVFGDTLYRAVSDRSLTSRCRCSLSFSSASLKPHHHHHHLIITREQRQTHHDSRTVAMKTKRLDHRATPEHITDAPLIERIDE